MDKLRALGEAEIAKASALEMEEFAQAVAQVQNSAMSRRDQRSMLFRIRKNHETAALLHCRTISNIYGVSCILEDILIPFKVDEILKGSVTIHRTPISLPPLDDINNPVSSQLQEVDSTVPTPPLADVSVSCLNLVPVAIQPIVPISRKIYSDLERELGTHRVRRICPYISYARLCVLQTYEYIRSFGIGVSRESERLHFHLENFPLMRKYLQTLRPFSVNIGDRTNKYVAVLITTEQAAFSRTGGPSPISRYLDGVLSVYSDTSLTALKRDVSRFNTLLKTCYSMRLRGTLNCPSLSVCGYMPRCMDARDAAEQPPESDDDGSVLSHLLLWLRKSVPRAKIHYRGKCDLFHHGYMYDPDYGISFLTASHSVMLSKLRQSRSDNEA